MNGWNEAFGMVGRKHGQVNCPGVVGKRILQAIVVVQQVYSREGRRLSRATLKAGKSI